MNFNTARGRSMQEKPSRVVSVHINLTMPTESHEGRVKWPSTIIRLTAHLAFVSDLEICKPRNISDTEYPS